MPNKRHMYVDYIYSPHTYVSYLASGMIVLINSYFIIYEIIKDYLSKVAGKIKIKLSF